jgi:protein gp37
MHPDILEAPLSWKTPKVIFVNSMSDLFHENIPLSFIQDTFDVMMFLSSSNNGVAQENTKPEEVY